MSILYGLEVIFLEILERYLRSLRKFISEMCLNSEFLKI